jgi:radical SAM superfamily enzyme YgiQ (UPF0313 family)
MMEDGLLVRLIAVNPERFSLGLAYLEATLTGYLGSRIRVEQSIYDLTAIRRGDIDLASIVTHAAADRPAVIGLSWYCWNHRLIQDLADMLAVVAPTARIVVGGPETRTIDENELLRFPDGTVFAFGEGEQAISEFVEQVLRGGPPSEPPADGARLSAGSIVRGAGKRVAVPPESIPSPVLAGTLQDASSDWLPSYTTTRGCVYRCSFCAWQDGLREREFDLGVVRRELDVLARRPYERIWITDTIFGRNEDRAMAILERLRNWPHPTRFAVELHGRFLSDRLAGELAEIPLAWAAVGIQSLAPDVLRLTRRSPHAQQLIEAVNRLYAALTDRSAIHLDVIFGLPRQTVDDCFETVDVLLEAFPDATIFTGMLQMIPGTAFESLRREPGWVALPPEGDCEVVTTPDLGLAEMDRVRDLTVGLDAHAVARGRLGGGSAGMTAARLETIGRSLRGTPFAAHPVYGRRESFTADQVVGTVRSPETIGV